MPPSGQSSGSWCVIFHLFQNINVVFAWCSHNAAHFVHNSISGLTNFMYFRIIVSLQVTAGVSSHHHHHHHCHHHHRHYHHRCHHHHRGHRLFVIVVIIIIIIIIVVIITIVVISESSLTHISSYRDGDDGGVALRAVVVHAKRHVGTQQNFLL